MHFARRILTTTLTTKGADAGAKYAAARTDYRTELLGLDAGGLFPFYLSRR
jgi:hypothetical protein